jgi:ribosome modulation factor
MQVAVMVDLVSMDLIEREPESRSDGGTPQREPQGPSCDAGATTSIQPEEFRAELACGNAPASPEPYEEGFGAYLSGRGLADNPYHVDNCAHLHWANGWSQARDEAQRQARSYAR